MSSPQLVGLVYSIMKKFVDLPSVDCEYTKFQHNSYTDRLNKFVFMRYTYLTEHNIDNLQHITHYKKHSILLNRWHM